MTSERFVVLSLASARSTWFRQVTGWAMSGALSLEFIKCLSVDELRARLRSGRPKSAVLLDGGLPCVDRDLLALADDMGAATIIVAAPQHERDWPELGALLVLQPDFVREDLAEGLHQHARPIRRNGAEPRIYETPRALPEARMVAVIGRPGSGVSTCSSAHRPASSGSNLPRDPRYPPPSSNHSQKLSNPPASHQQIRAVTNGWFSPETTSGPLPNTPWPRRSVIRVPTGSPDTGSTSSNSTETGSPTPRIRVSSTRGFG